MKIMVTYDESNAGLNLGSAFRHSVKNILYYSIYGIYSIYGYSY